MSLFQVIPNAEHPTGGRDTQTSPPWGVPPGSPKQGSAGTPFHPWGSRVLSGLQHLGCLYGRRDGVKPKQRHEEEKESEAGSEADVQLERRERRMMKAEAELWGPGDE